MGYRKERKGEEHECEQHARTNPQRPDPTTNSNYLNARTRVNQTRIEHDTKLCKAQR